MANNDAIDEAIKKLRDKRALLMRLQPCTVVVHLPPPGEQKKVHIEVTARLN